ncbi:MAG: STT3 domain-containing protein [Nanoarchaeota archaeon]
MAKKHKKSHTKSEPEIGFDFSKISKIFGNRKRMDWLGSKSFIIVAIFAFILISMLCSVYFRALPAQLPIADDFAEQSVKGMLKQDITSQVQNNYPNLPAEEREKIVNEQLSERLREDKINYQGQEFSINQIIEQQANTFRQRFKHDDGNTYLLAIDPYYYYRHTRNYVEEGNQFGAEIDGEYYDPLVLGGTPSEKRSTNKKPVKDLHVMISAWTYKIMSAPAKLFGKDISLMAAMFWVPVIFSALCVIPAFFIGRKIEGEFAGLISAMIIALHPAFLSRTAGGFADTDAYNVLFPLFAAWFLLYALEARNIKRASIWAGLTGVVLGLYSAAWSGWYFMLLFLFLTTLGVIAYKALVKRKGNYNIWQGLKRKTVKQASLVTGVFIASTGFFVTLFSSFSEFIKVFGILDFTEIKVVGIAKIWPNVYTTVAELNPAKLSKALNDVSLSSDIFLLFALVGMTLPLLLHKKNKIYDLIFLGAVVIWDILLVISMDAIGNQIVFSVLLALPPAGYALYKAYKKEDLPIQYTLLLLIWFAGTIYATGKGMRFILLMVPVFSIAAGVAFAKLLEPVGRLGKLIEIDPNYFKYPAAILIFILLFLPAIPNNFGSAAHEQAKQQIPSMNDAWYDTLTKIRDESSEDAIINSWWDFGHWFAAVAERSVTLDGGRQNSPQAHWLGKLMITDNETESVGILRYLDCGGNYGYNTLLDYRDEDSVTQYKTINEIYDIITLDSGSAKNYLENTELSSKEADNVLQYTHCSPPENYFITSEDMVSKSGVWAHFGSWDFERAAMFNVVHNNEKDEAIEILENEFDLDDAENMYFEIDNANADDWIAPYPGVADQENCKKDGNVIKCNSGITFNLETEEASLNANGNMRKPEKVAYIKDGEFRVKTYENNLIELQNNGAHKSNLGVVFIDQGNSYKAVLMDSRLTDSIFVRLFYFENEDGGLKHFEKWHETRDINGQKIIVWKVDWDGKNSTNQTTTDGASESTFKI